MTQPPPVNAYAPGGGAHISEVTVAAVDKIGNATSDQIRHTADRIEDDAKQIANKLRELAETFDEHTRLASEKVSEFCLKMASARNMVIGLESEIRGHGQAE
jgi:methyl-accepting chemotaxis protein